ncbi:MULTISPECIES: SphA family protein [Paraburkholderia]|jgi:hypothetical protein|uniref:SphA family protein n=1 Tax=Paraburkholderia TaxID=1822464 RepID=UPI00224EE147|nr:MULTISPECIES: transporter [Paraburkholderia]MCX4176139.1 transporter [Paraburkholderia madseniana]MDQ6464133.1 transporter [Paraburkholderia madseniana]
MKDRIKNDYIYLETIMRWRKSLEAAVLFGVLGLSGKAYATENGLQSYPIGIDTVLNAIVPAPGTTQFYDYSTFYTASRFVGQNGGSAIPGFKVNVFAMAPRVLHTWGETLGPVTFTSGFALPIVHAGTTLPFGSANRWGFGDLTIHSLNIGYSNPDKTFFGLLALDFVLPIGSYSASRLVNTGSNTYAFIPALKVTAVPFPRSEFSATLGYEINSPNHADGYHSGNLVVLDWVAGYSVLPKLQLGVQGYVLQQVTNDTQNGAPVDGNGFRGRAYAIGPQIRLNFTRDSGIVFKWQHEFDVRNRPKGDRAWIEFTFPLNL